MPQSIGDICPWPVMGLLTTFPFKSGHRMHFVKRYSNFSDVQLLSLSPALFHAALGTEKTHFQVCKMQLFRVNCSIARTFCKPPVKGAPFKNLGQSPPGPWFILLKGPMINIFFLLFCCIYFLLPDYLLPASVIASEPLSIFIFHLLLPC